MDSSVENIKRDGDEEEYRLIDVRVSCGNGLTYTFEPEEIEFISPNAVIGKCGKTKVHIYNGTVVKRYMKVDK